MRILRNKHHRRTLNFFKIAFGVMPPYKLLIDGNFVMQAVKMQQGTIEVGVQRVLMAACYLHITECIMRELRGLGDKFAHVVAAASKIPVIRCTHKHGHTKDMDASACIRSLVGAANPLHYVVATQDAELREAMRAVPGVPILLYSQNVLVLEPPSKASRSSAASVEAKKNSATTEELVAVKVATGALPASALAAFKKPAAEGAAGSHGRAPGAGAGSAAAAPAAARGEDADGDEGESGAESDAEGSATAGAEAGAGAAARRSKAAHAGAGAGAGSSRGGSGGGAGAATLSGVKRKRKGPSGPNPLSMRKKKPAGAAAGAGAAGSAGAPKAGGSAGAGASSGADEAGGRKVRRKEKSGRGDAEGGGHPAAKRARHTEAMEGTEL